MYKIYLGSSLVFDDSDIREERFVEEPTLEMEVGKAGTLKFSVYPNHPLYNSFYKLKSYVTLMRNDEVLFKGRVLSSEDNMVGARKITVEGSLAFLNDSVIRPYDLSEFTYQRKTPAQLLEWYLTQHNAQVESTRQIALGTVTVTLPEGQYLTPSTRSYDNTLSNINKQLLDECGGYLIVRYYNGVTYLDYLSEFTTQADQTVELGKNLLDITQTVEADELATIIIPLGNDEEIEVEYVDPDTGVISTQTIRRPITIVGVIDPETHEEITVDYIRNEDLIAEYGEIYKSVEFDCDLRINLYNEAKAYVDSLSMLARTIEVSALDLSRINVSLDSFRIGTNVHVKSAYHGVNDVVPVTKISLNILHPEDSQLTLGNTISSFTENNTREKNRTNKVIEKIKDDTDEEIRKVASTPMLQLSWDSVNSIAKMEQTDTDRLVQYPVTGGKIYVDCNDYSTMHNYKTVTNIPSNKMMFYALYPVTDSDGDIIYHPFFAMQVISNSGIKWYDVNDTSFVTEVTNIFVVGVLDMKNDTTQLWGVGYRPSEANTEVFMNYLATLDNVSDALLQSYGSATGIDKIFKKIAILEAFIRTLNVVNINAGVEPFKFIVQTYDSSGTLNPSFKVVYNSNEVFKVDPLTGKVYFGIGFWYDPSDSAIHSVNDKILITSEGLLKANGAVLSGDSEFNGKFDCSVIKTADYGSVQTAFTTTYNTVHQARALSLAIRGTGLKQKTYYDCSISGASAIKYIYIEEGMNNPDLPTHWSTSIKFYDVNKNLVDIRDYMTVSYNYGYQDQFKRYIHCGNTTNNTEYGVWVPNGFTVNIITSGKVLQLNIPTESEVGLLSAGQMYRKNDGSLYVKV